jgi:hypothetical protein
MAYGDRFNLSVKDFGRTVVLEIKRGTAKVSNGGKRVTIKYEDSSARGPREKAK